MQSITIFGKGFIGTKVAAYLALERYKVNLIGIRENSNYFEKINSSYFPKNVCVIIAAGSTRYIANDLTAFKENINLISSILEKVKNHRIRSIVFLSSIDVYGLVDNEVLTEKTSVNPADYYSHSKLVCEFMVKDFCEKNNIFHIILRLSGIYGKGDRGTSTIAKMITSAVSVGEINVYNGGKIRRDFVYIRDLCVLLKQIISFDSSVLLNVATGQSYTILSMAQKISALLGANIKFYDPQVSQVRAGNIYFDISKLKQNFPIDFLPLEEAVKDMA